MTLQVSNSLGVGILDPLPRENIGWWVEVYNFESHATLLARLYRTAFSFSTPLGDTGAFQLAIAQNDDVFFNDLPTNEAGSALLEQPHWYVMVDEGIPRFRGYLDTINRNLVDPNGVKLYQLAGPGIAACIGWGIARPIDPTGSADRTFAATSWAAVFVTLFTEAQERGTIPDWFTLQFDGAADTYGQAWTDVGDHTVPAGANLLEVLKQFAETYGFEWHVTHNGDVIAAARVGQDRSQDVRFFQSDTVISTNDTEDRKDMATAIFVADSAGAVTEVSDPTAMSTYGRREIWVTQSEITGTAARSSVGGTLLLAGKEPLKSRTFKVPFNPLDGVRQETFRRCFVDYVLGDTIGYGAHTGPDDDYRVVEIAVGVSGSTDLELTLTSRRQRDLEKLNRLIKRILAGQTGTATGAGASSVTSTVNVALSSINLEDLYNVERYRATGGELLMFDADLQRWKATRSPLTELADIHITDGPNDRDFLVYDIGLGAWTNPSISIDDMDDVSTKGADAPSTSDVLTWDGSKWKPAAGGGGGGGGTLLTWTKELDSDPMSSGTGWTNRSGTWTPGGSFGTEQTSGGGDCWYECDVDLSVYDVRAIEATVRVVSGEKAGFGFQSSGGWGGGALSVCIDPTNDYLWYDRYGSGGSTLSMSFSTGVDYVFKVVEVVPISRWFVYVDGTKVWEIQRSADINAGRIGLYTRSADSWFRDVTVWGGTNNWGIPT